ncbi:MAG: hypothetical protein IH969_07955 [Candidatus Krumholzibacteriota bacterium]|nr:hypothetical protein [Candidatus Krumholzibacteriota bacterium]
MLALACLALLVANSVSAATNGRIPARLMEASGGRVVFRVKLDPHTLTPSSRIEGASRLHVPGFSPWGEPGGPALPVRQFLVALPPQGGYSVTWRVLSSENLGRHRLEPVPFVERIQDDMLGVLPALRYRIEPGVYDESPSRPMVEARDPTWIRHNRVLPLLVSPVTYDVATGETFLVTEIEISVSVSGKAPDPTGRPVAEAPMWDGVFGRLVVNPGQVRTWRSAPLSALSPVRTMALPMLPSGRVRLNVRESAIHRVTAARLITAGFPVGQPISGLHLFQRTYDPDTGVAGVVDIALHVEEDPAGSAGVFDGNDLLVFYARRLRDDVARGDVLEKFSDHNVYWLDTTGGPVMVQRALTPGFVTADTASASFPVDDHFEIDNEFREGTPRGMSDFYYFNGGFEAGPVDMPFALSTPKPGTSVTLRSELHGQTYSPLLRVISLSLVNGQFPSGLILESFYTINNKTRRIYETTVGASQVDAGTNRFRIFRPDQSRSTLQVHINWVEASYQSLYRARGNALTFNTASQSGDTSMTVTGLSDTDLWLFDVTDPLSPVRCIVDPGLFTDVGGSLALSFRDNIVAMKRYELLPESRMVEIAAADIEVNTPSSIIGDPAENGVDVV